MVAVDSRAKLFERLQQNRTLGGTNFHSRSNESGDAERLVLTDMSDQWDGPP
jgi:hypothetical protein